MRIQRIVFGSALLFVVSNARAQYSQNSQTSQGSWPWAPGAGPYIRAGVGPAFFEDGNLKGYTLAPTFHSLGFVGPSGTVSYHVGYSGEFGFGYAFDRFLSVGFETGYTWAGIDSVQNYAASGSTIGNVPFLANVTLSVPIPDTYVVPYIGGGVGGVDSIFDARNFAPLFGAVQGTTLHGSQSDVVFGYQVILGVRINLNPHIAIGVGYDFLGTGNPTFSYPPAPNLNAEFEGIRAHTILFTFRATF